jgi:3-deoxy-manno-octulosonate cytidylyltransferase (CMP-KDO synthetase)
VLPTANIIGVIPARLASTRLERKALIPIEGVPMIQRVHEGARSRRLRELLVATDSDEILSFCERAGIAAVMTSAEHESGTDRVFEVIQKRNAEAVVNIQGDEPMIQPALVDRLVETLFAAPEYEVATLCTAMSATDATHASNTKVVIDARGQALYFSRAPIPFPRDGGPTKYRKHLGLYAYSRQALEIFHRLPVASLERIEKLEQLRFLENGISIAVAEVEQDTIGVDTAEDLARVEAYFRRKN